MKFIMFFSATQVVFEVGTLRNYLHSNSLPFLHSALHKTHDKYFPNGIILTFAKPSLGKLFVGS